MSNKPIPAAHSRHTPGSHGKSCRTCNPKKNLKGYLNKRACRHNSYRTLPHPSGGERPWCPASDDFVEL